jgi:formylglycine-generating enzyme required for sulfatase activity
MRRKALKNAVKRVLRGGSYDYDTWNLRASSRNRREPEVRDRHFGFRLVARQK